MSQTPDNANDSDEEHESSAAQKGPEDQASETKFDTTSDPPRKSSTHGKNLYGNHSSEPSTAKGSEGPPRQRTRNSTCCRCCGFISLIVLIIAFFLVRPPASCDMENPTNRDFDVFYGTENITNHFAITADNCNAHIIFTPALPQSILKPDHGASSFMILGENGTGKTLLRCEYWKTLSSDHYLKIPILNKQTSEYLKRFITSRKWNLHDRESHSGSTDWSDNEFAQLLLSVLVTEFIENYSQNQLKFRDIPIEEKINLITIICYYYNSDVISLLEDFANGFFAKTYKSYNARNARKQIEERHSFEDEQLLTHFETDLNEFNILNKDNIGKLHLLFAIIKGEEFQHQLMKKTMFGHVSRDLTDFSLFIKKHMKKIPVFIIDGIDESEYLGLNNTENQIPLESFFRSSVSKKILSLTMANHFYLSIFYPKIDGINMHNIVAEPDKFPIYTLTWNSKSLFNYADYVLQELNKNASLSGCKSLPDFKTLVNYENKQIAPYIDQIMTPRALHLFMLELITQMNRSANKSEQPFIATLEDVRNAFEKSSQNYYNNDKAKV